MIDYYKDENLRIINGDCLEVLKELTDNSIDAVVCDPPYELGFMCKKWDASGIAYNVDLWQECLRVLKPGGHLLAFGGTRTYHRMAVAIEDAGFEIRDMMEWIYNSGFPKSLNIGKAVDKLQGNEREDLGEAPKRGGRTGKNPYQSEDDNFNGAKNNDRITKGNSEWEGFGTALKPAHEPIVMARKPLSEKTIVENVLKHGTGALDIDGCRIPIEQGANMKEWKTERKTDGGSGWGFRGENSPEPNTQGRFPANVIVTDDALNDGAVTKSVPHNHNHKNDTMIYGGGKGLGIREGMSQFADSGSKSRYFDIDVWAEKHGLIQTAKAGKSERNKNIKGVEAKYTARDNGFSDKISDTKTARTNNHPTVKPVKVLAYLIRLISKENDVVLDMFMGSGSTGVAAVKLNRKFIGIELEQEYCKIAKSRIINEPKTLF